MGNPAVFSVAAQCFAGMDEAGYAELTAPEVWEGFVEGLGASVETRASDGRSDACWIDALKTPPSFADYDGFCRRHFTGGLPGSALPVESLYRPDAAPDAARGAGYGAEPARYMEELIERMGLSLPPAYRAWPDHLALELDMLAVLQRSGCESEARSFLSERFGWLADYRRRLERLDDSAAPFFVALVDALVGIVGGEAAKAVSVAADSCASGDVPA